MELFETNGPGSNNHLKHIVGKSHLWNNWLEIYDLIWKLIKKDERNQELQLRFRNNPIIPILLSNYVYKRHVETSDKELLQKKKLK